MESDPIVNQSIADQLSDNASACFKHKVTASSALSGGYFHLRNARLTRLRSLARTLSPNLPIYGCRFTELLRYILSQIT